MIRSRINKFIIGVMLVALAGSLLTGASVSACATSPATDGHCACASHPGCSHSMPADMGAPASSGCGCAISPAPDRDQTPLVMPVTSRDLGVDTVAVTSPEQIEPGQRPQVSLTAGREPDTYDFLYIASPAGRAPPA